MKKKLTVKIEQLTEAQRSRIRSAAEKAGWEVCFADVEAAHPEDSEVVFSGDMALIRRCSGLKWLCVPSAGVEPYLAPGVLPSPDTLLTNSSGAYGVTIAEHIVMAALMLLRRQEEYRQIVQERRWVRNLPIRSIRDARITLLGTGDIGRTAAGRFRAFGPERIVGVNRSGREDPAFDRVLPLTELDRLLPETDLLVMSLPATRETWHLMDEKRLSLLPEHALLINVGRGSTVEQAALVRLLKEGRLGGAALDVFQQEPVPPEDEIWDCPRLLMTPHVSGNMTLPYTVERITALFLEDFERYAAGLPLCRLVDRGRGY